MRLAATPLPPLKKNPAVFASGGHIQLYHINQNIDH